MGAARPEIAIGHQVADSDSMGHLSSGRVSHQGAVESSLNTLEKKRDRSRGSHSRESGPSNFHGVYKLGALKIE